MKIIIRHSNTGGFRGLKTFKSLWGARRHAFKCVGRWPDVNHGRTWAVSKDSHVTLRVEGATLEDIFQSKHYAKKEEEQS